MLNKNLWHKRVLLLSETSLNLNSFAQNCNIVLFSLPKSVACAPQLIHSPFSYKDEHTLISFCDLLYLYWLTSSVAWRQVKWPSNPAEAPSSDVTSYPRGPTLWDPKAQKWRSKALQLLVRDGKKSVAITDFCRFLFDQSIWQYFVCEDEAIFELLHYRCFFLRFLVWKKKEAAWSKNTFASSSSS